MLKRPHNASENPPMRLAVRTRFAAVLLAAVAIVYPVSQPAVAQDAVTAEEIEVTAFQVYELRRKMQALARAMREQRYRAGERLLRQTIEQGPDVPSLHYSLAVTLLLQGRKKAALDSLETAVDRGYGSAGSLTLDANLEGLRSDPRFAELVKRAGQNRPSAEMRVATSVPPAAVSDGVARVGPDNTTWIRDSGVLRSLFVFDPEGPANDKVQTGKGRAAALLNQWFKQGLAAGNNGDLYDNRDRDHSRLKHRRMPQMTVVEYTKEARALNLDYGFNTDLFFNAITVGNSSLAITRKKLWRSLPRAVMSEPGSMSKLYLQYINNQIYVYPEHRDHDMASGDTFPANTPYFIVSQGSSGSDQPFVHAIASILAAFPAQTKNALRHGRLVMPTVQMILRRGQSQIETDDQYLTGRAHPSVFEAKDIDLVRMVERANRMSTEDIPPAPVLKLVEQDTSALGTEHFAPGFTEVLFDTPAAIARIVRSTAYQRRFVVSAEGTRDPNGRELTFSWKVLRGDKDRITIRPLNPEASRIELIVPWHERRKVPGRPKLTTDRVDIGLFVHNGKNHSAPAFVSLMYPGNQIRRYDGEQRIVSVEYDPKALEDRYVDPTLFPVRGWRDTYSYDPDGALVGWSRDRGGEVTHYTRHGALIEARDGEGRAARARKVRYVLRSGADGLPRVIEQPTDEVLTYRYRDDSDLLGSLHAE